MQRLLHSAKFWTFIVTQGLSLAAYFIGKYANVPGEDIVKIITFIEGLAGIVIAAWTAEDVAAKWGAAKVNLLPK